jgi:hypothetical protein
VSLAAWLAERVGEDSGPLHLLHKCRESIDPNCSFLIVRLRLDEIYGTVTLAKSESPDLDQTVERRSNSRYYR